MEVWIVSAESFEQLQDSINQALAELKDKWIVDVRPLNTEGTALMILYAERSSLKEEKKQAWVK